MTSFFESLVKRSGPRKDVRKAASTSAVVPEVNTSSGAQPGFKLWPALAQVPPDAL